MNQVPVMYVEPNFLLTDTDKLRYSSKRRQRDMIPVIPLSALREVVEGLKRIQYFDGYDGCQMWRESRQIVDRLLAGLGEVGE